MNRGMAQKLSDLSSCKRRGTPATVSIVIIMNAFQHLYLVSASSMLMICESI